MPLVMRSAMDSSMKNSSRPCSWANFSIASKPNQNLNFTWCMEADSAARIHNPIAYRLLLAFRVRGSSDRSLPSAPSGLGFIVHRVHDPLAFILLLVQSPPGCGSRFSSFLRGCGSSFSSFLLSCRLHPVSASTRLLSLVWSWALWMSWCRGSMPFALHLAEFRWVVGVFPSLQLSLLLGRCGTVLGSPIWNDAPSPLTFWSFLLNYRLCRSTFLQLTPPILCLNDVDL